MKAFTLKVFVQNPDSGKMQPVGAPTQFRAGDIDSAHQIAKAKLAASPHPPVRAMNFGPENTIYAYCAVVQDRSKVIEGMTEYNRPPGPVRQ